jgi:hypothetical protein
LGKREVGTWEWKGKFRSHEESAVLPSHVKSEALLHS